MPHLSRQTLVLTSPPDARLLDGRTLAAARTALKACALMSERPLAAGEAHEFLFSAPEGEALAALKTELAFALAGHDVDANIIPTGAAAAHRRKKLIVADMDSTIIQQECIDEMADVVGLKARIAAITERAMRGELAFEAALAERLGLLAGLGEADLERVYHERIRLMPGARTLIATMQAHGAFAALISGGFTFFTARVATAVGFDENRANTLEMAAGRLTGKVVGPILGKEAKLAALVRLAGLRGISLAETLAVGDGANDLAMIRAAGLGVAYHAKPVVAAEADAGITHGDLTALLYLQGYTRAEFVTG